ncbi:TIR domain-containing protein [Streptomyces sp. NRRL F-5630]|uniref:WD40 domain-containing protein n=1 Tax=unclassified Streptomyces TaxID=2593676 RepID=UPI0004C55AEA|nr:TIR domain-containing protein [Streptomyces sp. NRRL F-5630]
MVTGSTDAAQRQATFFISYSPADEAWAAWIAWTLEEAGFRTVIQAWDFVAGSNFIDYMDRGVSESVAVIAVLSRNYQGSRYGRMEWQAALRSEPDQPDRRLLTVRVDEAPVEGLLATITYVDLVGVPDERTARGLLLTRVEQALDGHARPGSSPAYPGGGGAASATVPAQSWRQPLTGGGERGGRRRPGTAPHYPPAVPGGARQDAVNLLHLAGPEFGRGREPEDLLRDIQSDLIELRDTGAPDPELVFVSGDLTASGSPRNCAQALDFLTGLRAQLGLAPGRVLVVPGNQDVSDAACQAYFHSCEADEVRPQPPYWPKWRHFSRLFGELYQGLDVVFGADQPWTLFPVPELRTVVAGFNSSIARTHRLEDRYGMVGRAQAAWFAEALRRYEDEGWLRVGLVRHPLLVPARTGGGEGPGPLRDTDVFQRLLAPRLHVLLHGPGGDGRGQDAVPTHAELTSPTGALPLLGAAGPARFSLLRIDARGVERWAPRGEGTAEGAATEPAVFPVGWRSAPRFPGGAEHEEDPARDAPHSDNRAVNDPGAQLAERVKDVLRARRPGVRLRDVRPAAPEDLTQVVAAWDEDGVVRLLRVAVQPGTLTDADLDRFLAQTHADDAGTEAELVYAGERPGPGLRERAARGGVRVRSFLELQGLIDLREYVAAQTAELVNDGAYAPELYLPQRYRDEIRPGDEEGEDLVEEMLRLLETDQGRVLLLLGNFGHGKTFALRELARRIPERLPHLAPLLIPLRSLDRSHSLDGLVAAHLANHGVDVIDLRALRYMLRQGRVVLLFDGFDELVNRVSYERAADHLHTLLNAAVDRAKIVISGRTQHFRSREQVLTPLGEQVGLLPQRRLLSVEGFTPHQIRRYLTNYYGDETTAARRYELLLGIPQLLDLCGNPRLLSFVAALDEEQVRAVARSEGTLSAARLYEDVFSTWLRFEERRGQGGPGAAPGLELDQLWRAVTAMALRLWESGRGSLRLDELTEIVAETFGRGSDGVLFAQEAQAVGAGTLLIRVDDGIFHFIHESVIEWLVAREAARRLGEGDDALLARRELSPLAVEFFCDLADAARVAEWVRRTLESPGQGTGDAGGGTAGAGAGSGTGGAGARGRSAQGATDAARTNAYRITRRLRVPADADLRGVHFPGEDLSGRDLSGLDLTGANLTDAQLTGANLSHAVLHGARLGGARLDGTDLREADLRHADLRRARLIGADLRGARLAGSRWRRAVLIRTEMDEQDAASEELATATIAPGMPLETVLRPAAVSVPYGFSRQQGRLPEPVAYSPDGELLAAGSQDGSVLICAPENGEALRVLHGHTDRVYAIKFRDSVLATGSADGTVRLWDPVSGRCRATLSVHQDGVWPITLNETGTVLATGDGDGVVRLWDTASGEQLHAFPGHTVLVYTTVFSPDGRTLATGDRSGTVRLWDTETGRLVARLGPHQGPVFRVRFSPDGTLFATADEGVDDHGTVRIWRARDQRLLHEMHGHTGRVYTLDFHPDGDLLVSGDTDGGVRLWDPRTGVPGPPLAKGSGGVYQVVFADDGRHLAACHSDGAVRLWQLSAGTEGYEAVPERFQPTPHQGSAWACRFRPDDTQLVTAGDDGVVQIWDAATGQGKPILRGHGRRVNAVAFDATGTRLASASSDGTVRLWDVATGQRLHELVGRGDRLISAAFSPVGTVLATAGSAGHVYLWDAEDGAFLRELDVETDRTWAEAFSADGEEIATANDDDSVRLWRRATGSHGLQLDGHQGRVRSVAFAKDGASIATGCDDGRVRLWDARGGGLTGTLSAHTDRVYAVAFGAGLSWLASASWDGTAVIWRDGAARHVLRAHTGKLWAAAAHPSAPLLATAGDDRVIRLWDPATGASAGALTGHSGRIYSLSFSPDGTHLASAGDDGTVRLWRVRADGDAGPAGGVTVTAKATLVGVQGGWAAFTPDGGYKAEGEVGGEFWHVVGMTRFAPGELDRHLPGARRLARGEEL